MTLKIRYKKIKDRDPGTPAFYKLKPEIPNADKYINDLINDPEREEEAMQFMSELETSDKIFEDEITANEYKLKRKKEYDRTGLSFNSYIEMIIENDNSGMAHFRNERQKIKDKYPKPTE